MACSMPIPLLSHLVMHIMDVTTAITSYSVRIKMSHRCLELFPEVALLPFLRRAPQKKKKKIYFR